MDGLCVSPAAAYVATMYACPPGIRKISFRTDVSSLHAELLSHPELWDDFTMRTEHPQSPHRELSDIFVRYNPRENYTGDRRAFNEPHTAEWWPAYLQLPSVNRIVFDLMRHVCGERLGMVLITKIPAGKRCYDHIDQGWHARHYDKYAVQIASAPGQVFEVENVGLSAEPGECYWFDNSRVHRVINDSDHDRITMIVCIRSRFTRSTEPCPLVG